jgi:DNA invertase Pin-like site-specific DNA recombinase
MSMKYGYARVSPGGKSESVEAQRRQLTKAGCRKVFRDVHVSGAAGSQPVDQERAILIARHDVLDLALTITLAGYQCRIARATAVE